MRVIDEMMEDTFKASINQEDSLEVAQEEVHKIILELTQGKMFVR